MKKTFAILSLIMLIAQLLVAQEAFNEMYENQFNPAINNVFQTADTGFVTLGGANYGAYVRIDINYFNTEGEWVWNKNIGIDDYSVYHGAENACIKTEGGYIMAGSAHFSSNDTNMIYIVKYNEQFDTLWTQKHFVDTSWVTPRGICNTADGGFMVVGETQLNNDSVWGSTYQYGLMLKLDAEGQYEWFKSYGTDEQLDVFYKVVQTPDGGYLVGGATNSWQEDLIYWDKGDWYLVKTDSLGNEEWSRQYGNPELNDGRVGSILQANDSSYYLVGAKAYDRNNTGSTIYMETYIIKLDQDFNEVYELTYDDQNFELSLALSMVETSDSNLLVLGQNSLDYTIETRTTLRKITPEGETLWQRQFVGNNDTLNTDSYGNSIIETSDHGFLFGGRVFSAYISPYQQMWLVKTDSLGCDGTNDFWDCSTDVKINTYASNENGFKLYPNPTKNSFFVKFESSTSTYFDKAQYKCSATTMLKVESVCIYDITGKIVKNVAVNEVSGHLKIDVSDFESGIYMVKVGEQMQKLVVRQ